MRKSFLFRVGTYRHAGWGKIAKRVGRWRLDIDSIWRLNGWTPVMPSMRRYAPSSYDSPLRFSERLGWTAIVVSAADVRRLVVK